MTRPALDSRLTGAELSRWYWTLAELSTFARTLGVSASGGKQALVSRLTAVLDGASPPPPPVRRRSGRQLAAPVTAETVLPEGQRCSEVLRAYFRTSVGPSFHFDAHMRAFVASGAGRTLGDAVAHWHATWDSPPGEIGAQFELNRFLRSWHARRPSGTHADALAAWQAHRALPRS